ncbi:hypothetical protein N8I77_008528 [Diaporthe amygdali]|uniref:Zn(2)-C6 fungal-type domain-containing protein n=1 Tax=Phomopsis amygdali TaxID=1214568 RepID=A0AAD9W2N1_PHOAM|nr:hypothetical protein N8I77_008528 [Diaporthe amygdali]
MANSSSSPSLSPQRPTTSEARPALQHHQHHHLQQQQPQHEPQHQSQNQQQQPLQPPTVKKACDNCRLRKTKCDLTNPCTNCASRGFECTYATPHRKRGPAGRRLNEIREREQKRIRNAESTSVASSFSPSAPVLSVSNHEAAEASPGNTRGITQQNQQQQQHQQHQQDQFMFGTDSSGLPSAADQVSGLTPSWDGMLASFGPASASLAGPTASDSPDGPAGSAASNTFDDLVFSLRQSQYNNHSLNNVTGHPPITHASPASSSNVLAVPTSGWPAVITDENLIRWLDIYFERLYPTLPILKRSSVFARLLAQEHRTNPDFGAMLLSLSAFGLIQPVRVSEQQSASSSSRQQMVDLLLMEAVRMRTVVDFGQSPTMDMIFTSVFLFACLFQKGQHNAAWLRMREAVELGCIFGLDKFDCYLNCSPEQKQQRLRVYYLLSVTERAYGLQRHHSVGFVGEPSILTHSLLESISGIADSADSSGIVIQDDAESAGMLGLLHLMRLFDPINEDFLRCWNGHCKNDLGGCRFLNERTAVMIYDQIDRHNLEGKNSSVATAALKPSQSATTLSAEKPPPPVPSWLSAATATSSQQADILVNQQWLLNRLWHLCLSHKLLVPQSGHAALSIYNAVSIAENTLRICQTTPLASIEVHGIGMIEKLYTVVESAIAAIQYWEAAEDGQGGTDGGRSASGNHGVGSSQHHMHVHNIHHRKPLLKGYLELFKTIRAGQHVFLTKYNALVGQELGLVLE